MHFHRRCFRLVLASLIAFAASASGSFAHAGVPLVDGPDGMTCHYYAASARLMWKKKGGDWADAKGVEYGAIPFAETSVRNRKGQQQAEWDVTTLAREWAAGQEPAGVLMLRSVPGTKSGIVNFDSREAGDVSNRPVLVIEWDDGERSRLDVAADVDLPCPTWRSTGSRPIVKVGDGLNAVLVFPFEPRKGRQIRGATLAMSTSKQYGGTSVIGVYRTTPAGDIDPTTKMGIAAKFDSDRGIERHPGVIFADRFESPDWRSAWSDHDPHAVPEAIAADDGPRFAPFDGKALKVRVPEGKALGLNMHYRFARNGGSEPEEAYFRYYLRLGDDWDPVRDGGKLPGLSGTYGRGGWGGRTSNGTNGWSARGAFYRQGRAGSMLADLRGVGSYVYSADMKDRTGTSMGWNLGPGGMLEKNRWYSIEQRVRLNQPGQADGVLQAWIDGQLVLDRRGIRFRDVPELKIESVWMNVYHGGQTPAAQDMTLYIDNVVIAREYIGPLRTPR